METAQARFQLILAYLKTYYGLEYFIFSQEINYRYEHYFKTKQRQFNVIFCCEITKTHSTCKPLAQLKCVAVLQYRY